MVNKKDQPQQPQHLRNKEKSWCIDRAMTKKTRQHEAFSKSSMCLKKSFGAGWIDPIQYSLSKNKINELDAGMPSRTRDLYPYIKEDA
jgi:hypothetical protein